MSDGDRWADAFGAVAYARQTEAMIDAIASVSPRTAAQLWREWDEAGVSPKRSSVAVKVRAIYAGLQHELQAPPMPQYDVLPAAAAEPRSFSLVALLAAVCAVVFALALLAVLVGAGAWALGRFL